MDEFFRKHSDANWGVLQMDVKGMQYFYGPWSSIYPRLVRQFWHNTFMKANPPIRFVPLWMAVFFKFHDQ